VVYRNICYQSQSYNCFFQWFGFDSMWILITWPKWLESNDLNRTAQNYIQTSTEIVDLEPKMAWIKPNWTRPMWTFSTEVNFRYKKSLSDHPDQLEPRMVWLKIEIEPIFKLSMTQLNLNQMTRLSGICDWFQTTKLPRFMGRNQLLACTMDLILGMIYNWKLGCNKIERVVEP